MSAKKKYSDGTISRLLEVALKHRELTASDLNTYANDLFEVAQLGCWQKVKDSIIDNPKLTGAGYINTMKAADEFRVKVKSDIDRFKSKPLDVKLSAFRIANFLDVDFSKYYEHEDAIKKILGDKHINRPRELTMAIDEKECRDYALLTIPVRSRFNKTFSSELKELNRLVNYHQNKAMKKIEPTVIETTVIEPTKQSNKSKLKI
ncbi:hypothetical protein [Pseudomonas sp. NBRC 111121]|uniref:hypothetical protein n=1 Tax=Pseudomonas sp. NBRC 111121 TaxID=1661036 RepID=UPI00076121F2|nr:hypothetical protein [Pseudomonas sp. NBRC 111121]